MAIFESILAKKPAGIAVSPNDPASVVNVVAQARKAGIPVIAWDGPVPDSEVQGYIGTDNVTAGESEAEALVKAMGEKGKVAVVIGSLSATNLNQRLEGLKKGLAKHPGIKIVATEESGESVADAQTKAETILQAHPDLAGFAGIGGSDLPGIAGALKSAKKCGKIKAVGFDVVPQGIQGMEDGCVDALISQKPFGMTAEALQILIDLNAGKSTLEDNFNVDTGVEVVTPDTLEGVHGVGAALTVSQHPLVHMQGIVKSYPGVLALRGVDLRVDPGQVMGLVGENGAGKSTLLKVLAGAVPADAGTVEIDGSPMELRNPRDSQQAGIAVIYQELMLAEHLSVAENVFAGREPGRRWRGVDFGAMRRATARLLEELGVDASPDDQVGRLNMARRQMVEIARALSMDARVIVMDEPTSSLTEDEVKTLLALVRRLQEARGQRGVRLAPHARDLRCGRHDHGAARRQARRCQGGGRRDPEPGRDDDGRTGSRRHVRHATGAATGRRLPSWTCEVCTPVRA